MKTLRVETSSIVLRDERGGLGVGVAGGGVGGCISVFIRKGEVISNKKIILRLCFATRHSPCRCQALTGVLAAHNAIYLFRARSLARSLPCASLRRYRERDLL